MTDWSTLAEFRAARAFHGLLRLDRGRLHPIGREGDEGACKSSWVTFSR